MHAFPATLRTATCALLLFASRELRPRVEVLSKVSVDDGVVRLTDQAGHDRTAPRLKDQVSARDAKLAPDSATAGWLVEYENCCTSYPIPLVLVLYRDGRIRHEIRPGRMIYDWRFHAGGRQAALCQGTVHG